MIVVSNSTALVHLSAVGRLNILQDLFSEMLIPEEVYYEVVIAGAGKPGAAEVAGAAWIKTRQVANQPALALLKSILGAGEVACILLAVETVADLVILDDKAARQYALTQGLSVVGTIGCLLEAGRLGRLDFEQALADLLATGFRLHPNEHQRILNLWRAILQGENT